MSDRACLHEGCDTPAGYDLFCDDHWDDHKETFQCPNGHSWVDVAAGTCFICGSSECYLVTDDGGLIPV